MTLTCPMQTTCPFCGNTLIALGYNKNVIHCDTDENHYYCHNAAKSNYGKQTEVYSFDVEGVPTIMIVIRYDQDGQLVEAELRTYPNRIKNIRQLNLDSTDPEYIIDKLKTYVTFS